MQLSKTYNPAEVEDKWYKYWMDKGYFKADARSPKPKYSVVIPPPNVTGVLHMGHMLNNTIQDILTRRARMMGKEAVWVPGTDHASIATEAKVVKMLKEQGINKAEIGREKFLEHAWEWKEKYGGIILEQLKKLGASCDWDRTRFTMEPVMSDAVINVFVDLYEKGLIYRGERMVNWDPSAKTSVSDEEVIHKDVQSKLFYINYKIAGEDGFLTIATTRPETLLGDTAVCVNPNDERYAHLKGKKVVVPVVNREVPVIFDEYVDIEFGTGCLKVTPAHDINDFELGKKHSLETIDIFNEDGTIAAIAGHYVGMDRFAVRKQIVKDLEEAGQINKIEDIKNSVGYSERTDAVIEPRLSKQWFVDMKKFIEKNPKVLQAVMDDEIKFHPAKFKNTYRHWVENIREWCISRQLWWGQRIPAWYDEAGNYVVAATHNEALDKYKSQHPTSGIQHLKQDEDVVDTWFSSWLWPISVFDGFEDPNNDDIKAFYPTDDLVTAPEIIFFWVLRMIMAGYEYRGEKPFKNVYFTGIVRDKQGRKMSKQLGNSPDPLDLIAQYGADGVRMGMLLSSSAGNDVMFDISQVEQGRNFCNKIWNAYRLVKGWEVVEDSAVDADIVAANQLASKWLAYKLNEGLKDIEDKFKEYRLSEALMAVYKLVWDDYCAWYLEMVKPEYGKPINRGAFDATIAHFSELLKIVHPFMPFITEELYHDLNDGNPAKPIIIEDYPTVKEGVEAISSLAIDFITEMRNLRSSKGMSPKDELTTALVCENETTAAAYRSFEYIIRKLANVSPLEFLTEKPQGAIQVLVKNDALYVFLEESIDPVAERAKISEEINYLQGFLKSVDAKLSNEKFVANAKGDIVERERQKKADAEAKLRLLNDNLAALN
ncbi:MAG: valine--tRNA ligase [Bacteroidota bacterium]